MSSDGDEVDEKEVEAKTEDVQIEVRHKNAARIDVIC